MERRSAVSLPVTVESKRAMCIIYKVVGTEILLLVCVGTRRDDDA